MRRDTLSLSEARRIALAAQGFDRPRPRRNVRQADLSRVIRQLGLIQIDSVNVLVRAHYLVLFSRLGPYKTSDLDNLIYERREFTEQWAHEASILPVDRWPLFRHRMEGESFDRKFRALRTYMERETEYVARVLAEVRTRGALAAGEVAEPDGSRGQAGDWWAWTDAKAALEGHFACGRLAIANRRPANVARVYDLVERVLPREHLERMPRPEEAQRELVRLASQAHGVGTAEDLADYYRMPLRDARRRVAELVDAREIREVHVEGWRVPAYVACSVSIPRRVNAASLISPFDPLVWFRPRTARLFGFDYRLEIFVPRPARRWGYYVLPFLLGERFVARLDLKADRATRRLLVEAAHVEPGCDRDEVASAIAAELQALSGWLSLDDIAIARRGQLSKTLLRAVRAGR